MNKKDLIPVILLILMIPVWMMVDRLYLAPKFAQEAPPAEQSIEPQAEVGTIDESGLSTASSDAQAAVENVVKEIPVPTEKEQIGTLRNNKVELDITSLGGGIKSATLLDFPEFNKEDSEPVHLSFTNRPALTYSGLKGMETANAFNLEISEDGRTAVLSRQLDGYVFERTIALGEHYQVDISDRFIASSTAPCTLPDFRLLTGAMENPADTKATKGVSILGVDSYSADGGLNYWGRKLMKLYKNTNKPIKLDVVPEQMQGRIVDWVAAKNKFFTQIVRLDEPVATMAVLATRDANQKGIVPHNVTAALVFKPVTIAAGESYSLDYDYYIGPKQYSILKAAGNNMEGVMEFETIGKWSFMNWMMEPARKVLLWALNILHSVFHNYGVAIILLTILVRILFWPLTHKSTDKMRENSEKMQVVQPKVKALQEKYKNNPVKLREETMKIYQEHGFNPMGMMGGCLPMMLQMPVLFALFSVIRNAIELRYANFLWIADLSAPENLLMGHLPVVGSLNILPLLMAASMVWQQKLSTPNTSAATPEQQQQQKMMMVMMPVMMLFFFYSMPSGLVLYFTVSNVSMIAQTSIRNFRKKMKEA